MIRVLAAALPLLLCSCIAGRLAEMQTAFEGQIQALDDRQTEIEEDTDQAFAVLNAELDEGAISWEEYDRRADELEDANAEALEAAVDAAKDVAGDTLDAGIAGIKSDLENTKSVAARGAATAARVGGGILRLGPLGDLVATAILTAAGVTTARNRKRKQRGEPV